jgi:hypothetical protein
MIVIDVVGCYEGEGTADSAFGPLFMSGRQMSGMDVLG